MYIALRDDKIVQAASTLEEIMTAVQFLVYDSIEETEEVYKLHDKTGEFLTLEEIEAKEREELDKLSLTAADVERALYQDKGIDFDDILEMIKDTEIDQKRLKIEIKANNFYRGNPYINQIGTLLGYTSEELDYLFKYKEFEKSN